MGISAERYITQHHVAGLKVLVCLTDHRGIVRVDVGVDAVDEQSAAMIQKKHQMRRGKSQLLATSS